MLRTETILTLRSYTSLSIGIQGQLGKIAGKYNIVHDIERNKDLRTMIKKIPEIKRCVKAATFHKGVMDSGISRKGPFLLKGLALKGENGTAYGIFSIKEKGTKGTNKKQLITYRIEDMIKCSDQDHIIFGTIPITNGLFPSWDFVRVVVDNSIESLLVVCCNGCFFLRRIPSTNKMDIQKAEQIFNTLVQYDIIITANENTEGNTTIYRLARNSLLVGPSDYDNKVLELQNKLQGYKSSNTSVLSLSDSNYTIRQNICENVPYAKKVDAEILEQIIGDTMKMEFQPMLEWHFSPQILQIEVWISTSEKNGDETHIMQSKQSPNSKLKTKVHIHRPKFRTLGVGESEYTLTQQLEVIFHMLIKHHLNLLAISKSQTALDHFTNTMAHTLKISMDNARLFEDNVEIKLSAHLSTIEGEVIKMPTEETVVIPLYASTTNSVRMASFIAGLSQIGINAKFLSWQQLEHGGSLF